MMARRARVSFALSLVVSLMVWAAMPAGAARAHRPDLVVAQGSAIAGSRVNLSGADFGATEGVDVYFDRADLRLIVTGGEGAFDLSIRVPDHATPGTHWLTAIGRRSGSIARTRLAVAGTATWPQSGFDAAGTSWNRGEATIRSATVSDLRTGWTHSFAQFGYLDRVVTSQDTAFAQGWGMPAQEAWSRQSPFVTAVDLANGKELWNRDFSGFQTTALALSGDVLLVGTTPEWRNGVRYYPAHLMGLDAATGTTLWTTNVSGAQDNWIQDLVVDGDTVYVGRGASYYRGNQTANGLLAIDARDGSVKWQVALDEWPNAIVAENGTVVVGTARGVNAFDAATGALRWHRPSRYGVYELATDRGRVFTRLGSDMGGSLTAFDLSSGHVIWTAPFDEWLSGIAVSGNRLLASGQYWESNVGQLWSYNPATGTDRWHQPSQLWGGLVAAGDLVYTSGGDGVTVRDVGTGERVFSADGTGRCFGVVNGALLASTPDTPGLTVLTLPAPSAPRSPALNPDRKLQPDRGIQPHRALTTGWSSVTMAAAAADRAVTGSTVFEGQTYIGTRNDENGGGLYRLTALGSLTRVGTPGMGDTRNTIVRPIAVGSRLFVVTTNRAGGFQILSSADGVTFERLTDRGFGDVANRSAVPMVVGGKLVLGVDNARTGAQLWVAGPAGGEPFVKVLGAPTTHVGSFTPPVVFKGRTYVGTIGPGTSTLLRTQDATRWDEVTVDGLKPSTTALSPQVVMDGALYVIAASPDGMRVLRTVDGTTFDTVRGGFALSTQDVAIDGHMFAFGNTIYLVGTSLDPRLAVRANPIEVAPEHGFRLWRSDGQTWQPVGKAGLGDPHNVAAVPFAAGGAMYLAVSNYEEGDSLFRSTDGFTWQPTLRETSASHASLGLTPVVVGGSLIVFHSDLLDGIHGWRTSIPVAPEPAVARSSGWLWVLVVGLVLLIGIVIALVAQRRRGRRPPTIGPLDEYTPPQMPTSREEADPFEGPAPNENGARYGRR